jgi:hypothetical protein
MNKILKAALLALLLAATLGTAKAQTTLGVEPPVILQDGVAGQTITTNIKVGNPGIKSARVRISLGDWNYSQAGELQYFAVGKLSASAAPWAKLSETIVTVPAKGSITTRYTVTVPSGATPGSHWGVIFFTAEPEATTPGATSAAMTVRVAHTFYVNVPVTKTSGKITGIFGRASADDTSKYLFTVQYVNSGNTAQVLGGRIEIRDSSGKTVAAAPFIQQVVLPGTTRILQTSLTGPLGAGDYTALVVLNYGDKNKDIAGEYSFTLKKPLTGG